MGEAEDTIFARRRQREEEQERAKKQLVHRLSEQLRELIPQAVNSLRRNNYPTEKWPLGDYSLLNVENETRVGWLICGDYDRSHAYLLADGQLTNGSGKVVVPEDIDSVKYNFNEQDADFIVERLNQIINFTPDN